MALLREMFLSKHSAPPMIRPFMFRTHFFRFSLSHFVPFGVRAGLLPKPEAAGEGS
jgi:hypothetical protein